MRELIRVTLGAVPDRGLPERIEYWTDRRALEDRLAPARAMGRPISIQTVAALRAAA